MKALYLIFIFLISTSIFASDVSFRHGKEYTSLNYEGSVTAICNSGSRFHYCAGYDLKPSMFTKLVSAKEIDGDKYELTATHEDGKHRNKKGRFSRNVSSTINLWIRSVFQRPLLKNGINQIDYKILKNKEVVKKGQFEVNVTDGGSHMCRQAVIQFFGDDCNNVGIVCTEYFRRGYCSL